MAELDRVLIAGGGIGGLTAAIAFARRGFAVTVLERQSQPREAGAGIQIGPNGVHALRQIGLELALDERASKPEGVRIRQSDGRELANFPLGSWISHRHGASYLTLHRADLHAFLYDAACSEPAIEIVHGFQLAALEDSGETIAAVPLEGKARSGGLLVGADGLWSAVRPLLFGAALPHYYGKTAWRTVIAGRDAQPAFAENAVGLWLGAAAHLVHYPVRGGPVHGDPVHGDPVRGDPVRGDPVRGGPVPGNNEINLVAVIEDPWRNDGWNAAADVSELLPSFSGWSPNVLETLQGAGEWRRWTLMERPDLAHWSRGRSVLLGDAAHPVLPFLAQGGVLAIEDAVVLANACEGCNLADPAALRAALADYERQRMPRAKRVQAMSKRNGRVYHLSGAMGKARNLALAARPGVAFMRDLDWLYGYRTR